MGNKINLLFFFIFLYKIGIGEWLQKITAIKFNLGSASKLMASLQIIF